MELKITNQSFKGYSDSLSFAVKNPQSEMAFVAVKVDNLGSNDLDEFRKLKKECLFSQKDIDKDVFIMTKVKSLLGGEFYSFDGLTVPEPKEISDNPEKRSLSEKIYKYMLGVAEKLNREETVRETEKGLDDVILHAHGEISRVSQSRQIGSSLVTHAWEVKQPLTVATEFFCENFKKVLAK